MAGDAAAAARALADARGNYAAGKRSDKLTGLDEAAELRAAASHSGQNGDNAARQRIASLLLNPKQAAGYSSEELAALEEVVRGTASRNALRFVGNLAGGGGGLGAVVTGGVAGAAGGSIGGPLGAVAGAAIPAVGFGAKKVANALTSRAVDRADELVRMRSPLYEQMMSDASMSAVAPERRAAIVRALMAAQQEQER